MIVEQIPIEIETIPQIQPLTELGRVAICLIGEEASRAQAENMTKNISLRSITRTFASVGL